MRIRDLFWALCHPLLIIDYMLEAENRQLQRMETAQLWRDSWAGGSRDFMFDLLELQEYVAEDTGLWRLRVEAALGALVVHFMTFFPETQVIESPERYVFPERSGFEYFLMFTREIRRESGFDIEEIIALQRAIGALVLNPLKFYTCVVVPNIGYWEKRNGGIFFSSHGEMVDRFFPNIAQKLLERERA